MISTGKTYKSGYDQGCFDTVVETLHGKRLNNNGLHHYAILIQKTLEENKVNVGIQKEVENYLTAMINHVEGIRHKK